MVDANAAFVDVVWSMGARCGSRWRPSWCFVQEGLVQLIYKARDGFQ